MFKLPAVDLTNAINHIFIAFRKRVNSISTNDTRNDERTIYTTAPIQTSNVPEPH